jgi:hypothetical protein
VFFSLDLLSCSRCLCSKAYLLLPWVSVRGRRSGLLTAATTGNWEVLQLVLGAMLEAEISSVSNESDTVRGGRSGRVYETCCFCRVGSWGFHLYSFSDFLICCCFVCPFVVVWCFSFTVLVHHPRSPSSSFTIILCISHSLLSLTIIIHDHIHNHHSHPHPHSHSQVRARLRQEARFSTLARAMEGAASRGHDQCCELLWECCDLKSKQRSVAAAELNGHSALMRNMSLWLKAEK